MDKFVGDSVMTFGGPPFTLVEDHALLACRAAWGQLAALHVLRRELPELTGLRKDPPAIDLRIGICTGEVLVGVQDCDSAEMTFRACLELRPNDGPAALFLKRTETLRRNAPGVDWRSISQLEEK